MGTPTAQRVRTVRPLQTSKADKSKFELPDHMRQVLKDYQRLINTKLSEEGAWNRFSLQMKHAKDVGDGDCLIEDGAVYVCIQGDRVLKVFAMTGSSEKGQSTPYLCKGSASKQRESSKPDKVQPGFMRMELVLGKTLHQMIVANELLPGLNIPEGTEIVSVLFMGEELDLNANLTIAITSKTK